MASKPAEPHADPTPPEQSGEAAVELRERDDFDRNVWCVFGLPVDATDLSGAALEIDMAVRDGRRLSFVTPNVNWLVRFRKNREARRRILDADLSLVDGAPLVLLARLLGAPVRSRAAGSDLFDVLRKRARVEGRRLRVFFLGGRDGAAQAAAKAVDAERGGVEAAGWHNPGYGDVESMSARTVIDRINAARPDFVLIALAAEKGQAWIDRNQARLSAPVIAHLGATMDFVAGRVRRAPAWIRKAGLEWAWRVREEPALWRRYVSDGCALIALLAASLLPLAMKTRPRAKGPARAETRSSPEGTTVTLAGVLSANTLGPARAAFRRAGERGGEARLVFDGVKGFDAGFLGLVLMLEKHLTRRGGRIVLQGITPSQRAVFRANAMPYAVEDADRTRTDAFGAAEAAH